MSSHRQHVNATPPAVLASRNHVDQVAAVEAAHDHVQLSLTPAAATELARILVQYGSAVRTSTATSPSNNYDAALWHDIGLLVDTGASQATTTPVSRYVAPRDPESTGRRRNGRAPLTVVGSDQ